ncbi:uncharacterized protein LOC133745602 [Rosa rugosa]|uniref:uncharacterized protein LOC133745602 n=1 Tax=Rosa rugosa TaxID=74645 RepID=UPI002B41743A|nr:uncharacterized protein LOC133745602 [Rosa rugosa]
MDRSVTFETLRFKTSLVSSASPSCVEIKYQLPNETLEARLVSVAAMISEFEAWQRIPVYLFDRTAGSACRENAVRLDPHGFIDAEEDLISLPRVGDDYPQASVNSETSPATSEVVVNGSDSQTLAVGQEFSDTKAFRDALVATAIAKKFELTFIRSDRARVTAKCAEDGCSWRIHASKLPDVDTFQIKALKGVHCCVLPERSGHRQAKMKWILNCIMDRVRENINYKPKEIIKDIEQEYGVIIPYLKAHRAKERALELIYGMPMKDIVFNQAEVQGVEKALHDVLVIVGRSL